MGQLNEIMGLRIVTWHLADTNGLTEGCWILKHTSNIIILFFFLGGGGGGGGAHQVFVCLC